MGKKKSVTFADVSPPPAKSKKEKSYADVIPLGSKGKKDKSHSLDLAERQKHINNLLETKKELENKIKLAAHVKKKKAPPPPPVVLPPLAEEIVCCVPLCSNTSFSNKNKVFFPFPLNKKVSKQWVTNVGRKGFEKKGAENLAKNYKVCSDHFESHMFVPKTKNKILVSQAVPTLFESIHEPVISIHTSNSSKLDLKGGGGGGGGAPLSPSDEISAPATGVKKPPKRNRTKKKVLLDDDFEYDNDDVPLSSLLPPKLSMKKKLIKKKDATNKTKWMYKPNVQIVEEYDKEACDSSGSEYEPFEEEEEDAIEEDAADENYNPAAKKKKMGSRKKVKEILPLTLECWSDELSPAQKEAYANANRIYEECKKKLDELAKMKNAKLVFNNDDIAAYEIDEGVGSASAEIEIEEEYSGAVAAAPGAAQKPAANAPAAKRGQAVRPPVSASIAALTAASNRKLNSLQPIKPQESTSLGGLFSKVSKSSESGSTPDSKEMTFNKLAGKTYPSLVVIARPSLKLKDIPQSVVTSERTQLDAKVKAVLLYTSNHLTEWLIQQGLLRSEQNCTVHQNPDGTPTKLKLGMYSDVTKFPHSGGYVWISECCPSKFVSVFYNSIFEGAPHAPSVLVKLMYHWACQTSIGNVTSWVKIDNLYLKTFYSYMRCVCTSAVHEKHELIGGAGKKVEVGVISLGTTNVDGNLRQVKVEVLGVFETNTTKIRLRAIEPLPESERNQKKRFAKIMEPLKEWVHPDSIICTDFTVDKSAFLALGFKNVYQVSLNDVNPPQTNNKNIMEYLRRVVPRMFQNTLSLLSRHIIQQFLDELVWRERFGPIPSRAFESIVQHLAEQTKLDTGDTLLNRYQRISVNPFANWQYNNWAQSWPIPTIIDVKSVAIDSKAAPLVPELIPVVLSTATVVETDESKRGRKRVAEKSPVRAPPAKKPVSSAVAVSVSSVSPPDGDEDTSLETYYYATLPGKNVLSEPPKDGYKFGCPVCAKIFSLNTQLLVHLETHAIIPDWNSQESQPNLCRYCLKTFTTVMAMNDHIEEAHLKKHIHCKCLICQEKCREKLTLIKHMQRSHNEAELPYACYYCEFRSSEHKVVVDHFYETHARAPVLQCPYCLKMVTVAQGENVIDKNVAFFLMHLQRHQKKTSRKCNRCMLTFINKMLIREHQIRDHGSYKGVDQVQPYPDSGLMRIKRPVSPTAIIPVPKLKLPTFSIHYRFDRFDENVKMPPFSEGMICHECEVAMGAEDHFLGVFTCMHCFYVTCCINGMHDHAKCFHAGKDPEYNTSKPTILDTRMYCVCGFNSNSGNKLARHTAMCKKISVYPSEESADSAKVVVKGSTVLNILGLIRRDEEAQQSSAEGDVVSVPPPQEGETLAVNECVEKAEISETSLTSAKPDEESSSKQGEDVGKPDEIVDSQAAAGKDLLSTSAGVAPPADVVATGGDAAETIVTPATDASQQFSVETGVTPKEATTLDPTVAEHEMGTIGATSAESVVSAGEAASREKTDSVAAAITTATGGGNDFEDVAQIDDLSCDDATGLLDVDKISAEKESELLQDPDESKGSSDDTQKISAAGDDSIDEESLLNSEDDSNLTATSKPNEGQETSELPSDVDSNEPSSLKASVEDATSNAATEKSEEVDESSEKCSTSTKSDLPEATDNATFDTVEPSSSDTASTFEGGDTGKSSSEATFDTASSTLTSSQNKDEPLTESERVAVASVDDEEEEDDDDAELIKQDMAALQQDLAALSGTCDIPLNTILDRQLETRPPPHQEVMETESPPLPLLTTTSSGVNQEKMDEARDSAHAMEVEGSDSVAPTSPTMATMDCDSSNTGDNMLVE